MKKIFNSLQFLLIVVTAFGIARCNEKKESPDKTEENAIAVRQQAVSVTTYTPTLSYSGSMASVSEQRLSFKVSGIISRIYVKEGDQVRRGQLLATLDLTEINAQVQQASQQADKARRDAGRMNNLYKDTVATLEQYQNAQTQLDVAEQNVRIVRFNQQYAQIRATEDGTVLQKIMNEGELANAGAPVFQLSGTAGTGWVIRIGVPDRDWAVLQKGNEATVSLDAYPGQTFRGVVSSIASGADPVSGTYEIEVKVFPNGARFASGLFANVQVQPSSNQRIMMIPIEALAEGDGKKGFVYTVNQDGRSVTRHAVSIAFLEKNRVAINGGLDSVQRVITEGAGYLSPKSIIRVMP